MPPKRPREDETRTYTVLTFAPSVRWFDEHDILVITVSAPRGIQVLELLKLIQPSEQITCRGLKLTRKIHDDEKTPMTKFHFISDNAGTPELPLYIEVVQDPSHLVTPTNCWMLTMANAENISPMLLSEGNSSVPHGTINKGVEHLTELLKKIQQKHRQLQFCVNGAVLERREKFIESIPTEIVSLESIHNWLGVSAIPNSVKNKKTYEIIHDSNHLWSLGETKYQTTFNETNKANRFMVSAYASNGCIPYPKLPDGNSKFVVTSGCGDNNVSLVDHMSIEWKGPSHITFLVRPFCEMANRHYDVIRQSIERVYAMSCYQEYFSDIIVFAVCADMMWIIKYTGEFVRHPETNQHRFNRKIDIIAANPSHLGSLWGALTYRAIQRKQCGFNTSTADYFYLTQFLNTICPNLAHYCRTRCIGSSMNRVYAVTLPQQYGDGTRSNQQTFAASARTKHLAVKVIASNALFDQEVACLERIWGYINQLTGGSSSSSTTANASPSTNIDEVVAKRFYAYGYMRMATGTARNPPTITLFNPDDEIKLPGLQQEMNALLQPLRDNTCQLSEKKHKDVWWLHQPVPTTPLTGGVIIMHCGDYSLDGHSEVYNEKELLMKYSQIRGDLSFWLELIHNAGVLHRDLRLPNILRFKSTLRTFVHHHVAVSNESGSTQREVHADPEEGEWQLIDFNVSACLERGASTADTLLKKSEAQFKYGGWRLHRKGRKMEGDSFVYEWSQIDDMEMLMKTLSDIPVHNVH